MVYITLAVATIRLIATGYATVEVNRNVRAGTYIVLHYAGLVPVVVYDGADYDAARVAAMDTLTTHYTGLPITWAGRG